MRKTSISSLSLALLAALIVSGCEKTNPSAEAKNADAGSQDAVQLKEGHGLLLHPKLLESIKIEVADAGEERVAPVIETRLHVVRSSADGLRRVAFGGAAGDRTEAGGWITRAEAEHIHEGQPVELRAGAELAEGTVVRLEKASTAALGEFEVAIETEAPFAMGTALDAVFRSPSGDPVTAVPRTALLETAEGRFVYAVNESFFLRIPVKTGAVNSEFAEITEGLYAGDQIVVSPVDLLWMAELQILRGGKSCTCGH